MAIEHDTAKLRALMMQGFDARELIIFCFDYYREVHDSLPVNPDKPDIVHRIIEYCVRRDSLNGLIASVGITNQAISKSYKEYLVDNLTRLLISVTRDFEYAKEISVANLMRIETVRHTTLELMDNLSKVRVLRADMWLIVKELEERLHMISQFNPSNYKDFVHLKHIARLNLVLGDFYSRASDLLSQYAQKTVIEAEEMTVDDILKLADSVYSTTLSEINRLNTVEDDIIRSSTVSDRDFAEYQARLEHIKMSIQNIDEL